MKQHELLHILRLILSMIDDVVIVRNQLGDIIYCNKDGSFIDYKKLTLLGQRNDEFKLDDKTYSCYKSKFKYKNDNYYIEKYIDITEKYHLKNENQIDYLTNLLNKRAIDKELKIIDKNKISSIIIMGDIDNFKRVNDTLGHIVGDSILKMISSIIKSSIKIDNIIGRYGGEEFLIILKCDIDSALLIIEKIRKKIAEIELLYNEIKKITMSFGISKYDGSLSIIDSLSNADQALYESKASGKNKITIYKNKTLEKK